MYCCLSALHTSEVPLSFTQQCLQDRTRANPNSHIYVPLINETGVCGANRMLHLWGVRKKASFLKNQKAQSIKSETSPGESSPMVQSEYETVEVRPLVTFFSFPPDDVTSTPMHRNCSRFLALQSQKMCASESRIACCGGPCTRPPLSNSILYNFTHFRFQVCVDLKGSCTLSLILFF